MSKGSNRRPSAVPQETVAERWERTFYASRKMHMHVDLTPEEVQGAIDAINRARREVWAGSESAPGEVDVWVAKPDGWGIGQPPKPSRVLTAEEVREMFNPADPETKEEAP